MEKQVRLTRSQVLARLHDHASTDGFVSFDSLNARDKLVLRCIPLYFTGLVAARHVAGVPGPPHRKSGRKTGPKPGGKPTYVRKRTWSRKRVVDELRRLHRDGQSTGWRDLLASGRANLIQAAQRYAGGLTRARRAAGVATIAHRRLGERTWTKRSVLGAIRARHRDGQSLAATHVPQDLYTAARTHLGSWPRALAAVGINGETVRAKKYTKEVIIDRLQDAAREGNDLRAKSLARVLDLKAVQREFGTLEAAICAAGLAGHLRRRRHGLAKWTRERLVEVLRERASRGITQMTPGLFAANQKLFGGTREARAAAGIPDPTEATRRNRRGVLSDRRRRIL